MKKYKNFFINTLIIMAVMIVMFAAVTYIVGEIIIGKENICYMASQVIDKWYTQKKAIVYEFDNKGNKTLIVSGSNALFSIDSEKLKKETKLPIINYSSHGGLCSYIFYEAKRVLKPFDTVLLPLEYEYYDDSTEIDCLNNVVLPYIIGYDREYYKQLSFADKFKVLNFMFSNAFYEKMRIGNQKLGDTYSYKIDEKNNMIENVNTKPDFAKSNKKVDIKIAEVSENYKKWELYKFLKWCQSKNITVYALAPAIYHDKELSDKEKESFENIKKFYDLAGVKFAGNLENGFYSEEYMYDTNYHLNYKGREKHTDYLIKLIKEIGIK